MFIIMKSFKMLVFEPAYHYCYSAAPKKPVEYCFMKQKYQLPVDIALYAKSSHTIEHQRHK